MWRLILVTGSLLAVVGCGGSPLADLKSPEQLTLFSIDGRDEDRRGEIKAKESFHGYPVLGKVEITDPEQRERVIAALKDGIAQGKSMAMAKCFWPRHGLRAVENGKTVDYVICFECSRFEEFLGEKKLRHEPINSKAQSTFDKPLQGAGVPIAPK